MPDINFSTDDAVTRFTDEYERAVQRLKDEYQRLVTQLHQTKVARQQIDERALQLGAAAIGVISLRLHDHGPHGRMMKGFMLSDGSGAYSERCELVRPLKPGNYRVVVIFTEDEEKTETPI